MLMVLVSYASFIHEYNLSYLLQLLPINLKNIQ